MVGPAVLADLRSREGAQRQEGPVIKIGPCPQRALTDGYEQSPAVNDGSLRSILPGRSASEQERPSLLAVPSKLVTMGRAGAADGRHQAVNLGHSRSIDPQVGGGLEGLARAAGGAEVPLQRRGQPGVAWDMCFV
jgi:hypothetical protein